MKCATFMAVLLPVIFGIGVYSGSFLRPATVSSTPDVERVLSALDSIVPAGLGGDITDVSITFWRDRSVWVDVKTDEDSDVIRGTGSSLQAAVNDLSQKSDKIYTAVHPIVR